MYADQYVVIVVLIMITSKARLQHRSVRPPF